MSDESAPLQVVKCEGAEQSPLDEAPSNKSLLGEPLQREHLFHLYEKEALLYDAVAHFASAGLAAGEPVILIATELHRRALVHRLGLKGCRVEDAIALGQLALLDAHH